MFFQQLPSRNSKLIDVIENGSFDTTLSGNILTITVNGYVSFQSGLEHQAQLKKVVRDLNGKPFAILYDGKHYNSCAPDAFKANDGIYWAMFKHNLKAIAMVSDNSRLSDDMVKHIHAWDENRDRIKRFGSYVKALNWLALKGYVEVQQRKLG